MSIQVSSPVPGGNPRVASGASTLLRRAAKRFNAPCPIRRQSATNLTCAATAANQEPLPGKQLKDPIRLQGTRTHKMKLKPAADPSLSLGQYMKLLGQDFSYLEVPLGAKMLKLSGKAYQLIAPRIQLWDVWIQPTSLTTVDFGDGFIELKSTQCHLKGSDRIPDMNDLFNLLVKMRFNYDESGPQPTITSEAIIVVDLDVPSPFNATPKAVLEATGNTAFATTLQIMLDGYMRNLSQDYEKWQADPMYRASRVEAAALS